MYSDLVYELFARWEKAVEDGEPFDVEEHAEPAVASQVNELIRTLQASTSKPVSRPPDTARYQFTEFVAMGGMGEVWRGMDRLLGRSVAIKVIKRRWGVSERDFWHEAQLVAKLSHPGIAPVYDYDKLTDGRPFFAMKFVDGTTFEDVISTGWEDRRANTASWLRIFRQICETVAYAHSFTPALVHRDLKPQNVMVGVYGEVYVMDWGIAKAINRALEVDSPKDEPLGSEPAIISGSLSLEHFSIKQGVSRGTFTGLIKGTTAYMSPEQATGQTALIGPASDVFALGGILCRLLTGLPTFPAKSDVLQPDRRDVTDAHLRLEGIDADPLLISIAKTCLAHSVDERFNNAGELLEAIKQFEIQQEERARQAEIDRIERAAKSAERTRTRPLKRFAIALAVVLCATLAISGWQTYVRRVESVAEAARLFSQAELTLKEAHDRLNLAHDRPLDGEMFQNAVIASQVALKAAEASHNNALITEAQELLKDSRVGAQDASKNRRLLSELLEAHATHNFSRADLPQSAVDTEDSFQMVRRHREAFLRRGLDISYEDMSVDDCVVRLKALPVGLRSEVAAAIDRVWLSFLIEGVHIRLAEELIRIADGLDSDRASKLIRRVIIANLLDPKAAHDIIHRLEIQSDFASVRRESVTALLIRYRALALTGRREQARKLITRLVNESPDNVLFLDAAAEAHEQRGTPEDLGRAIEYRRSLRGIRPEVGQSLAKNLLLVGRIEEAEVVARELAKVSSKPEHFMLFGICLSLQEGRETEEMWAYQEALRLRPDFAEAKRQLERLSQHRQANPQPEGSDKN